MIQKYENRNFNNLNIIATRLLLLCVSIYMISIILLIIGLFSNPLPEEDGAGFMTPLFIIIWMLATIPSPLLLFLMMIKTKHTVSKLTKLSVFAWIIMFVLSIISFIIMMSFTDDTAGILFFIFAIILAIISSVILFSYRSDLKRQGIEP